MEELITFINQYLGKTGVGNTDQNRGQCVGLVSLWMDTLNIPHEWGNAKDLLDNADKNYFTIVYNDPNNLAQYPPAGAVLVYDGTWGNGVGHTGIVVFSTGTIIILFEQNDTRSDDPNGACEVMAHPNYNGVIGWLIPKNLPTTTSDCLVPNTPEWQTKYEEIVGKAGKYDAFVSDGYNSSMDIDSKIKGMQDTIDSLNQIIKDKNAQIAGLNTSLSTADGQINGLKMQVQQQTLLAQQLPECQKERDQAIEDRKGLQDQITALQGKVTGLSGTSYKTVNTILLVQEVLRRLFHLN